MFLFIFISGEWYCSIVVTTQKPQLLLDRKRVFKRMDFYCQVPLLSIPLKLNIWGSRFLKKDQDDGNFLGN
nr:hypothetical protein BaRGS_015598 [Batillaria attramentaria]